MKQFSSGVLTQDRGVQAALLGEVWKDVRKIKLLKVGEQKSETLLMVLSTPPLQTLSLTHTQKENIKKIIII